MSSRRLLGGGGPQGPERIGGEAPETTRLPQPQAAGPAQPVVLQQAGQVVGSRRLLGGGGPQGPERIGGAAPETTRHPQPGRISRSLLLAICALTTVVYAEDARLLAAGASLDQGQPVMALDLLREHPDLQSRGAARCLAIRAYAANADLDRVRELVGDLDQWAEPQRSEVAWWLGRIEASQGDLVAAKRALIVAANGRQVQAWAAIDLLIDVADHAQDRELARRCALLRWQQRPRRSAAAYAGLRLAAWIADTDPAAAQRYLNEVRVIVGVEPRFVGQAGDMLCSLLLDASPADALLIAERGCAAGLPGQAPLWRALALAALDPDAGRRALDALPAEFAHMAEVVAARQRLDQQRVSAEESWRHQLSLAEVDAKLGRWTDLHRRLGDRVHTDANALALAVLQPDIDLTPLAASPAAGQQQGAQALARAWLQRGQADRAWSVLAPWSTEADPQCTYWCWRAAQAAGQPVAGELAERLRGMHEPAALVAEAWADLAATSEGERALAAWEAAAPGLPRAHPWHVVAVEALLRAALAGAYSPQKALFHADELAETGDERWQTTRFLEAQVAAREGDGERVKMVVGLLVPYADERRRQKLESLLSSLAQPSLLNPGDTPDERGSRR